MTRINGTPFEELPIQGGDLVERALDGQLGTEEWSRFEAGTKDRPEAWEDLARELVDALALRGALAPQRGVAERVELPRTSASVGTPSARRWLRHPALGWAATLLIVCTFWFTRPVVPVRVEPAEVPLASLPEVVPVSADEAFDQYVRTGLEEGRFVQELPRLVLETSPVEDRDGAVEVVYVRRLVERTVMDELYELAYDDAGDVQPRAVPAARLLDHGSY